MNAHRPGGGWPARAVRLASHALPAGPTRDRYEREFLADLAELAAHGERRARARYAFGVLSHCLALRHVVRSGPSTTGDVMTTETHKPLLCRTDLHHHWTTETNPDGEAYQRCSRCGTDRGTIGGRSAQSPNVAGNMAANMVVLPP